MSIQYTFHEREKVDHTIVKVIDHTLFFNLLQDIGITKVVFDVRSKEDYDLSHARAAISLPIDDGDRGLITEMENILSDDVPCQQDQHDHVVAQPKKLATKHLFDTNPKFAKNAQFRMRGLLYKTIILYNECPEHEPNTACFALAELLRLENLVEHVFILHKYTGFEYKYPFLCSTKDGGVAYNRSYPSEIVDNFLYLGDRTHATTKKILDDLNIRYILNMAEELENMFEDDPEFSYEKLGVGDTLNDNIRPMFEKAVEFIKRAQMEGRGSVLVHCNMGVSRSTTALVSYLMTEWKCNFDTAFEHVKIRRSIVHPNATFRSQLDNYYHEKLSIRGNGTTDGHII